MPDDKSRRRPIVGHLLEAPRGARKRRKPDHAGEPARQDFNSNVILTTVGRCIFNDILPKAMPFYNYALTSKGASRVIADTYAYSADRRRSTCSTT